MSTVTETALHRFVLMTAGVAAAFILAVVAVLSYQLATATTHDPWRSPQLLALKEQLAAAPADEAVKERIRTLDLQFRRDYRRRLRLAGSAGWLLAGGFLVLIVSLQAAAKVNQRPPQPRPDPGAAERAVRVAGWARASVGVGGAVCLGALVATGLLVRSRLEEKRPALTVAPPVETLPSTEEFARNWPQFRGPQGGGVAPVSDAPITWDAASGAGVAWKVEVPLPGFNSPIVWGDRVFVAGATRELREIFCFESATGKLAWRCRLEPPRRAAGKPLKVSDMTGFAAPTMATDGRRVYAIFAHGDVTAVTFDGAVAWTKDLGVPENPYGHANSLAVGQGKVIVQLDQESRGGSRLIALDGATGRVVWEKPRDVTSSWATPLVFEAAGKAQVVALAEPFAIAYALGDGAELWRAEAAHGEIVSSPIFAAGLVVVVYPSNELTAIRPEGAGDVTKTHVAWKSENSVPDVTSPVSDGEFVFMIEGGGMLTCLEAKDGKKVWEHDLKLQVQASPVIAGRRLYVPCEEGVTVVVEIGRAYRELARNPLGEKILASPAVAGGRFFLRGTQHLFCLTQAEAKP